MHDAKGPIAFGDAVHEHTRRTNVHELFESQVFGLHLSPDAENMLRSSFDSRLDAGGFELALEQLLQFLDVMLAVRAPRLQSCRNSFVFERLQIPEGQTLELPFDLPDAEPIRERRVALAALDRVFPLQRFAATLRRA